MHRKLFLFRTSKQILKKSYNSDPPQIVIIVIKFSKLFVKYTKFYRLVFGGVHLKISNASKFAIYFGYSNVDWYSGLIKQLGEITLRIALFC